MKFNKNNKNILRSLSLSLYVYIYIKLLYSLHIVHIYRN